MPPDSPGYPGWTIWRSDAGRWYAVNPDVSMAQLRAGCAATVDADSEPQLTRRIQEQIERRAREEVLDEVLA